MLSWPPALGSPASGHLPRLVWSFQSPQTKPPWPERSHELMDPTPGCSHGCGQFAQTGHSVPLSNADALNPNPQSAPAGMFPRGVVGTTGKGNPGHGAAQRSDKARGRPAPPAGASPGESKSHATNQSQHRGNKTRIINFREKGIFLEGSMHGILVP